MTQGARALPDHATCQRAMAQRDAGFDGVFIAGTASTRIYCRPSCPATPAKPQNLRFFADADAARSAGYRACRRCDPDSAGAASA